MSSNQHGKTGDDQIRDSISGWIVIHHRATDSIIFGPFSSIVDAQDWLNQSADLGVRGTIVPLVDPNCDRDVMWCSSSMRIDSFFKADV